MFSALREDWLSLLNMHTLGLQAGAVVGTLLSCGFRGWRFRTDVGRRTLGEVAGQTRIGCQRDWIAALIG